MKKDYLLLIFLVLILAAWFVADRAVTHGPKSDAQAITANYTCDQGVINATFHNADALPPANPGEPPRPQGTVDLKLADGRSMTLKQTISADGVRYSDGDPTVENGETFVFWTKGNEALVLENNEAKTYTNCTTGPVGASDYKNATYMIEGNKVTLVDGTAMTPAAPGSSSMITTKYFGNEVKTDLNGDGKEDIAFIVTESTGGSGTFYYAVAALNTDNGYIGSDGYLLGDRVAPQATTISPNPKQKGVVVFNYADRAQGEPMSAQPSVGKSVYLKLDSGTMQWGIVQPDFEGESK